MNGTTFDLVLAIEGISEQKKTYLSGMYTLSGEVILSNFFLFCILNLSSAVNYVQFPLPKLYKY